MDGSCQEVDSCARSTYNAAAAVRLFITMLRQRPRIRRYIVMNRVAAAKSL